MKWMGDAGLLDKVLLLLRSARNLGDLRRVNLDRSLRHRRRSRSVLRRISIVMKVKGLYYLSICLCLLASTSILLGLK
jgi:hypothetical protein